MQDTKQQCQNCSQEFPITIDDQKFYQEMAVPMPKFCPDCRQQRRLIWRNERTLHKRKCDATGKDILSPFSAEAKFPVYANEYWYSDKWNAKDYGRDFDFNRSFFEQFQELMNSVPQLARSALSNQNCDYVNQCGWCKNCYLIFEADHNENCMYSHNIYDSKNCIDNLNVGQCELCYECVDCLKSYNLKFSQDCRNCSDSWFLKSCIGCRNCFGCVNLKNKEYYFLNQKYSKEEYEKKIAEIDLSIYENLQNYREKFAKFSEQYPAKHMHGIKNEDSTGDYLSNTQRCQECYDVYGAQDCKWVSNSRNTKKVYDMTVFGSLEGAEFCYENHEIGAGVRNLMFCDQVWSSCYDIYYSKLCQNSCHHLFGCVGLTKSSYRIFNKQYSPEEYEELKNKIIAHMKKTGEWGEFFPASISPFAYNETAAQYYYPLSKEEALNKGYKWRDKLEKTENQNIENSTAQNCVQCQKAYRITPTEEQFYQRQKLPIPQQCHDCRHKARFKLRNPRQLHSRHCDKCQASIQTTYSPSRPEKIYCQSCYQNELV